MFFLFEESFNPKDDTISEQGDYLVADITRNNIEKIYPIAYIVKKTKIYEVEESQVNGIFSKHIKIKMKENVFASKELIYPILGEIFISTFKEVVIPFLYSALKKFEKLFAVYLSVIVDENSIQVNRIPFDFFKLVSYNYTNFFELAPEIKVLNIHGRYFNLENIFWQNIIFGINTEEETKNSFSWFEKYNRRITNKATDYSLQLFLSNCKTLAIFGHSISEPDFDSLSLIINRPWNKITLFYNSKIPYSLEMIICNLRKLMGMKKFTYLVDNEILLFLDVNQNAFS